MDAEIERNRKGITGGDDHCTALDDRSVVRGCAKTIVCPIQPTYPGACHNRNIEMPRVSFEIIGNLVF